MPTSRTRDQFAEILVEERSVERLADALLAAARETVARGFDTAAEMLDLPEHRAMTGSYPGYPSDMLRRWAEDARSQNNDPDIQED